ncbi:hypothetical protein DRO24_00660 [Candidatus Bathyarchaeota archaeon]|nr:MAG: hypothetical protein DRO24_00660 [Candidatus Bathyarchaeota archaeon]
MDGGFILEGIKMFLLIIVGIGIIGGIIFFFKRYQIDQIFYGALKKRGDFATFQGSGHRYRQFISPQEFRHLKSRMDNFENRVEKLEKIIQSILSGQKQETPKSGVFRESWQEHEPSLLNDFLTEMIEFVDTYRKSKLEVKPRQILTEREKVPKKIIPTTTPEKKYKPINDINLISWWQKNAHNRLSVCRESFKKDFGKVYVEPVKGQGEEWNLIGVSSNGVNFYILPRKGGWEDEIYQDWFTVEEGIIQPGELIRSLTSPLPRARKVPSGWQRVGRKGKVSIKGNPSP